MTTLQTQLNEVNDRISQLDPNNRDNLVELASLEQKKAVLTMQIDDIEAHNIATQERIQIQEERVESIQLPYNFSEIFDDPRADLMIVELIRDFQRQAYSDHNEELNGMIIAHREEIRAATDRELQLKRQNDDLQARYEEAAQDARKIHSDMEELSRGNQQLLARALDAESKRDAAVSKAEELEAQLAEKAKAAVNVTSIAGSDKLAQLIQESKNAKVKSALDIALENAAPFRGKVISDGQVVANLDAPQVTPFPIIDQTGDTSNQLVTGPAESVPADDQVTFPEEAVSTLSTGLAEGVSSEVGESGKTLEERVKALELHVFGA